MRSTTILSAPKRVLVTGARGCIGSHLVKRLQREGHQVVIATSGQPTGESLQADFCQLETHQASFWQRAIETREIDVLINLAGGTSIPKNHRNEGGSLMDINFYPVQAMAKAASLVSETSFIQVSSMATRRVFPVSKTPYSESKFFSEVATREMGGIIARPDLVFSDTRAISMRHAFSPNEVATLHGPLPILGSGLQRLQPVALSDTVEGLYRLIENPTQYAGEEFDFVGPDIISQVGLLSLLKEARGEAFYPMFIENNSKAFETLCELAEIVPYGSFNKSLMKTLEHADKYPSVAGFSPRPFESLLGTAKLVSLKDVLSQESLKFVKPPIKDFAKDILSSSSAVKKTAELLMYMPQKAAKSVLAGPKRYTLSGTERTKPVDIALKNRPK